MYEIFQVCCFLDLDSSFLSQSPLCLLKESINLHIEAATFDREVKNHSLALSLKTRREKKKKQVGREALGLFSLLSVKEMWLWLFLAAFSIMVFSPSAEQSKHYRERQSCLQQEVLQSCQDYTGTNFISQANSRKK